MSAFTIKKAFTGSLFYAKREDMQAHQKRNNNMTKQEFQEFLEQNREKIRKTIPTNPSITKDDEWRDDRHND